MFFLSVWLNIRTFFPDTSVRNKSFKNVFYFLFLLLQSIKYLGFFRMLVGINIFLLLCIFSSFLCIYKMLLPGEHCWYELVANQITTLYYYYLQVHFCSLLCHQTKGKSMLKFSFFYDFKRNKNYKIAFYAFTHTHTYFFLLLFFVMHHK